jgi:hypothetical protein
MIQDVDDALRKLVLEAVNGSGVEASFDAPTKEWAAKRNAPTVNLYLYDVREDVERRQVEYEEVRNDEGRVVERRPPPRRFKLSYLVSVWTQRPEDEHRLLSTVIGCVMQHEAVPAELLGGTLEGNGHPAFMSIGLPPPGTQKLSDIWSALGGELKPSLDLVVSAPFDTARVVEAGPPVLEEPRLAVVTPAVEEPERPRRGRKRAAATPEPTAAEETVQAGTGKKQGRILRVRDLGR